MRLRKTIVYFYFLLMLILNKNVLAVTDTTKTEGFKKLPDTTQIRILVEMSDLCEINEIPNYTTRAILIGKKIKDKFPQSEYVEYYAAAYNNEAFYYDQVGNIKAALKSYLTSLSIREEIKDSLGMGESYNNLAFLFQQQGDLVSATNYYNRAKDLFTKLDHINGLVNVYINLGYDYYLLQKYDSAQFLFEYGLELAEKVHDLKGASYALNNLAGIYNKKGMVQKTEETYLRSLEIREETKNKDGIARSHHNLGRFYLNQNNIKKAFFHAQIAYEMAQELKSPDVIAQSTILLSDIYYKEKDYKKAYDFMNIHVQMKDSILSDETRKTTIKEQAKYEYEKQKALDDKENEKQLAIAAEQKQKQKVIIYAIGVGLGLVIIFAAFIFNRLQITRRQKLVIEEQKQEVEKQKEFAEEQRQLAEHQKILVEEKNQEITDSIQYAKRIQNAILPSDKAVKEFLQDSFILYKPKDIVAGDFYWLESIQKEPSLRGTKQSAEENEIASSESLRSHHRNDVVLFAAADCTGHGVPGAMVSVVCNNALNRSVREHGLTDPGKILDKTREIVVQEFEKSDEKVQDGMDIALCKLEIPKDKSQKIKLEYAGANNPLWILKKGELMEVKANKQPIGKFENPLPYKTHSFDLEKGDIIYIFSDGFSDQFGGEKGKKYKAANFKSLLISIQYETMEKQLQIISKTFEDWKGDLEQIDDVCIIGVRI